MKLAALARRGIDNLYSPADVSASKRGPIGSVLVACEFSGRVRDAFAARGWNAWSCDLIPTESPGNHYLGDVLYILHLPWDLLIAHPPCTHLATSGARWFRDKLPEQKLALEFALRLYHAPIKRICLENPVSILSSHIDKPPQVIQPWQFGHPEKKATCLWLKGLPHLAPTKIMRYKLSAVHQTGESSTRARERSRTYTGIAAAMAEQYTNWHLAHPL